MWQPITIQFSFVALSLLAASPLTAADAASPLSPPAAASAPMPLSRTAAATAIPSPSATSTLTPVPAVVEGAPKAPGQPEGSFWVLTRSTQAPLPVARLRWKAAEPGSYLIKGYRLFRAEAGGPWAQRGELVGGYGTDDEVAAGRQYQYQVEAVDVKGHQGPRSPALDLDLRQPPAELLAPRMPASLTAYAGKSTVKLLWAAAPAWVAPVSGYRVYRADLQADAAPVQLSETAAVEYTDTPPAIARDYHYSVRTVDRDGRVSLEAATATAGASGALPAGAPAGFTASAKVEKVMLSWSAALPGTAPVTAYVVRRRSEDSDQWQTVALLPATMTAHTDKADGDQGYLYSVAALDSEGVTGTAAYAGASPTSKIWNKTAVILMPTAYANYKGGDRGLNLNVLFDFYVGSLYEGFTNPVTGFTKNGLLQPLQIATVTSDLKYGLLDDRGLIPGLAVGLYTVALIPFGNPGGGQSVGVSSAGGNISTLGNVYGVISKRFWPGKPRAAVHAGFMLGKIADGLASDPTPKDWRPTLRHLSPGGDVPLLLNRLVDPKLGATVAQSPHMVFGGVQVPFSLPLIFTTWNTGLRVELMAPLPDAADYPANTTLNGPARQPSEMVPLMANIHIDNLPLFGFEFSFFQYQGGYQVIAFYHIPDLTWTW
jgi:hypothetical protein